MSKNEHEVLQRGEIERDGSNGLRIGGAIRH